MNSEFNWSDEDRKSRVEILHSKYNERKKRKREKRRLILKLTLKDLIHQIKIIVLVVTITSAIILFLCSSAWYILKNNEENQLILLNDMDSL